MAIVHSQSKQGEHSQDREASDQQPDQPPRETWKQQYQREYYRMHRVRLTQQRRARYRQNPTPTLLANRQWVIKNRERRRAYQQAWYLKKLATLQLKRQKAYAKFRERVLARSRVYYANRTAVRRRQRRYCQ
jgi:hypothetical protein